MKKLLALMFVPILVLSLAACGNNVPAGTYKMIHAPSSSVEILKDITTLEVKSDGSATLDVDMGRGLKDSTEVVFDESKGTVTFDESHAKYSVSGNVITFEYDNGSKMVFKK